MVHASKAYSYLGQPQQAVAILKELVEAAKAPGLTPVGLAEALAACAKVRQTIEAPTYQLPCTESVTRSLTLTCVVPRRSDGIWEWRWWSRP